MTKKVIIIDDNLTTLKVLQTAFKKLGWMSYGAKNAKNAFDLIYETAPDIIITDAIMPVIGGFKFVRMLREDNIISKIPTIIYSTIEERNAKFYIKKELGEYFLKKTPNMEELTFLAQFVIEKHPVSMNDKLKILKKGIETKVPINPIEIKKEIIKEEIIPNQILIKPPLEKKEEVKKEKNQTYYAIITLLFEQEDTGKLLSLSTVAFETIKKDLNKNEKIYKNEIDEYSVIIYAKDATIAKKRFDNIINIINSIDSMVDVSIGAVEYENNLDFDIEEAYDLAFEALHQTTNKEKTVIKNAKF